MVDRHGPMRTGQFSVEIDDVEVPGWQTVEIPASHTEQSEYREGNEPDHERKLWGQTTFDDLEMERGMQLDDTRIFDWREAIIQGNVNEGRREVTVELMDEEGQPRIRWTFTGAWVKTYDPPTLEASADGDVATESITVSFDRMTREHL